MTVTRVGLTSIVARTTISEADISRIITYVHHDFRVLVNAVDVIAGIVACTCCLLAIHDKCAAVTPSSGDECPGEHAHGRVANVNYRSGARPRVQQSSRNNRSSLHFLFMMMMK